MTLLFDFEKQLIFKTVKKRSQEKSDTYVFHLPETFNSLGMGFVSVVGTYSSCFD